MELRRTRPRNERKAGRTPGRRARPDREPPPPGRVCRSQGEGEGWERREGLDLWSGR